MLHYKVIRLHMNCLSRRVSLQSKAFHSGPMKSLHPTNTFLKSLKVIRILLMISRPCVYFSMAVISLLFCITVIGFYCKKLIREL
ncbi:hypothetical protein Hdeb2414_s0512g00908051 [Helianthus debilis subsp. tardiflorus]